MTRPLASDNYPECRHTSIYHLSPKCTRKQSGIPCLLELHQFSLHPNHDRLEYVINRKNVLSRPKEQNCYSYELLAGYERRHTISTSQSILDRDTANVCPSTHVPQAAARRIEYRVPRHNWTMARVVEHVNAWVCRWYILSR